MEVDLVRTETSLAIELDGPHHLSGADAYRRDRRKDLLLQENGFFVVRGRNEMVKNVTVIS